MDRFIAYHPVSKTATTSQAAIVRMTKINSGSQDPVFYTEEANARLKAGNLQGALDILDLADKNCGANDFATAIRITALRQTDPAQAVALRMGRITARSEDPVFYNEEANARMKAGDLQGALDILDLADKNCGPDDITTSLRTIVLQQTDPALATVLRMERITADSQNSVFYIEEAKARLKAGNLQGALDILDLADKNCGANDFITSLRALVLQQTNPARAAVLRMERITAGSQNTFFYCEEAKARLKAGNLQGALDILDLADKNCGADDFTTSIRTTALQQTDPALAAALRMEKITAGSRNSVFYNEEAMARLRVGNLQGALDILDLADKNCGPDDFTTSIRTTILQQTDPALATALRMERITAGSEDSVFYNEEVKARLKAGNVQGALDILDMADKNCGHNDFTASLRTAALQQTDPALAAVMRMEKITAGS